MERFYVEHYLQQRRRNDNESRYPSCYEDFSEEETDEAEDRLIYRNKFSTLVPEERSVPEYPCWTFEQVCREVKNRFLEDWDGEQENMHTSMQMQKKAMIGYENEVAFFKGKIRSLLEEFRVTHVPYPVWYDSLVDGVYHENWGMAGMAQWFGDGFQKSSSAKVIGERIYFMENGKMCLKPQTVSRERREQLIRAFLLLSPEERLDKAFHEVYLLDGTRITVFRDGLAKQGQDTIIFRRYVVPSYSFEEQARRHTIPAEAIPLFCSMVDCGYSVVFSGAVRTAKTTFLSTWQRYEDPRLEGVMVETDPEIPLHKMMPEAPIVQLLADNERMTTISKNLLRSDADYFILAEARDGVALDTAVRIAGKGTKRMKITFHTRSPLDFPQDAAMEIVRSLGGDPNLMAKKVAASFDYVFHFIQLKDKSKKRLSSLYELALDRSSGQIQMNQICRYRHESDDWEWFYHISEEKRQLAWEENGEGLYRFEKELKALSGQPASGENHAFYQDEPAVPSEPTLIQNGEALQSVAALGWEAAG